MKVSRATIGVLIGLLAVAAAQATGIVEEGPDGSIGPWTPCDCEERENRDEPAAATEDTAEDAPADGGGSDGPTPPTPALPVFTPTVRYPDSLFLAEGPSILGNVDLPDFLAAMEADRLLLAELRKNVPETRDEALHYLNRLKQLAERSDPTRLAIRAKRVLEQAPIYFDWLETEFESQADEVFEYYVGGAQGFSRALQEFQNAALLTALNRLDVAARVIEESYQEE